MTDNTKTVKITKPKTPFLATKDITIMAMMVAFIAVCSQIAIPMTVPFTLQTFAVFITAYLLGTKKGTITVISYILLGIVGCPVFAGFTGGAGAIVGSTGGYIIGFIFTSLIVGVITKNVKFKNDIANIVVAVIAMFVGDVACFVIGTAQFMMVTKMSLAISLSYCVIPFIIPDLAKMIVAAIFVNRVKKYARVFD